MTWLSTEANHDRDERGAMSSIRLAGGVLPSCKLHDIWDALPEMSGRSALRSHPSYGSPCGCDRRPGC